jgi:hypothetical protein
MPSVEEKVEGEANEGEQEETRYAEADEVAEAIDAFPIAVIFHGVSDRHAEENDNE